MPGLRRNGLFPPGMSGTTGDYGLPAGARYGNMQPNTRLGAPARFADTGRGNTTSESTGSVTSEELVTPAHSHTPIELELEVPQTTPGATPALLGGGTATLNHVSGNDLAVSSE
jgi:hypothetical protein